MKFEIFTIVIIAGLLFNTYHNGKYTKLIGGYKKYMQMAAIVVIGISIYLMVKRQPNKSKQLLMYANNMVKYMPLNKNSSNMIPHLFDLTSSGEEPGGFVGTTNNIINGNVCGEPSMSALHHSNSKLRAGGSKPTKRSVSETKKKYVASNQGWKCGDCGKQLNAWFEVDHKIRLDQGGSNEVTNLVAMCRECHGSKTAMENM